MPKTKNIDFQSNNYIELEDLLEYAAELREEAKIICEDESIEADKRERNRRACITVRDCVLCIIQKFYLDGQKDNSDAEDMAELYYYYHFNNAEYREKQKARVNSGRAFPEPDLENFSGIPF